MIQSLILCGLLSVLVLAPTGTDAQGRCQNPRNQPGVCISIYDCPVLKAMLQEQPMSQEKIRFLQQSQCDGVGVYPNVCCPTGNPNEQDGRGNIERNMPIRDNVNMNTINWDNNPLLPSDCGKDLTQRIYGGNVTALDEFPWMALLEYVKLTNGVERQSTLCGGVLINKRYVLSAAHCVHPARIGDWRLTGVRLGEYNIETNPDCVRDDEDMVCADEPLSIGIDEYFVHENYVPDSRDQRNDIALIRLKRNVQSSTYIKPICLPRDSTFSNDLHVAGWGRTEIGYGSAIKLKLAVPLADQDRCSNIYRTQNINLGQGQICAGGRQGEDTCRGDSGGPLMSFQRGPDGNGRWTCVGIVSFGPDPCGTAGWPGVYTIVSDFVPWIVSKMRT